MVHYEKLSDLIGKKVISTEGHYYIIKGKDLQIDKNDDNKLTPHWLVESVVTKELIYMPMYCINRIEFIINNIK